MNFSYDNYSNVANLKYSYLSSTHNWINLGTLIPHDYKTLQFENEIPAAWKIEVKDNSKLQCVEYYSRQPITNTITLKDKKFTTENNLLLDVLSQNGSNEFIAYIITEDGDGFNYYSNVIDCIAN